MHYRFEIHLSPGATVEHLQALLEAAKDLVPFPLQTEWVTAEHFHLEKPGTWVYACAPDDWATHGTPLFLGLLRLEREPANEVWLTLGPVSAHAGYNLSVLAADRWLAVYQV